MLELTLTVHGHSKADLLDQLKSIINATPERPARVPFSLAGRQRPPHGASGTLRWHTRDLSFITAQGTRSRTLAWLKDHPGEITEVRVSYDASGTGFEVHLGDEAYLRRHVHADQGERILRAFRNRNVPIRVQDRPGSPIPLGGREGPRVS